MCVCVCVSPECVRVRVYSVCMCVCVCIECVNDVCGCVVGMYESHDGTGQLNQSCFLIGMVISIYGM